MSQGSTGLQLVWQFMSVGLFFLNCYDHFYVGRFDLSVRVRGVLGEMMGCLGEMRGVLGEMRGGLGEEVTRLPFLHFLL